MHQEDGMMDSINISVPVSVLPMTDELLRRNGVDFLNATKVGNAAQSDELLKRYGIDFLEATKVGNAAQRDVKVLASRL